jgi:hypothetical protein
MVDPTEEPLYEMILGKVLWGEPREEVFHSLSVNGITGERAERIYTAAWEERLTVIRRDYARKAGLGLLLLLGGAAVFSYFWFYVGAISRNVVIGLVAMLGVGAWKSIDGIAGMLMAGSKEGSVADDV